MILGHESIFPTIILILYLVFYNLLFCLAHLNIFFCYKQCLVQFVLFCFVLNQSLRKRVFSVRTFKCCVFILRKTYISKGFSRPAAHLPTHICICIYNCTGAGWINRKSIFKQCFHAIKVRSPFYSK